MKTEKYYFSNFGNVIGKAKKKMDGQKVKGRRKDSTVRLKSLFVH